MLEGPLSRSMERLLVALFCQPGKGVSTIQEKGQNRKDSLRGCSVLKDLVLFLQDNRDIHKHLNQQPLPSIHRYLYGNFQRAYCGL